MAVAIDWSAIMVAVIAFVGTLGGSYISNRKSQILIAYRLEQLELKVQKHNNLIERTYKLEELTAIQDQQIQSMSKRMDEMASIERKRGNDNK